MWIFSRSLIACTFFALIVPHSASARLLQIIHTNDLHSEFEHAEDFTSGSYAAVRATMDSIRAKAQAQGIESLTLDAGDFTEGTEFYLVDQGQFSWKMMNSMGYDAVTIGNHDWLIGANQVDQILGAVPLNFQLLGANFLHDISLQNLTAMLHDSADFVRSGLKISVIGLTTDEFVYNWRVREGMIGNVRHFAKKQVEEVRTKSDVVIALTHIGLDADLKLPEAAPGIDLIVGGHSHSPLYEPVFGVEESGKTVPIVQAGSHGMFVGDLLVNVEPGKPLEIVRYQLVPVLMTGEKSAEIAALTVDARKRFEEQYGADWLYSMIGFSEVPLERPMRQVTAWGNFVAESLREAAGAEIALDVGQFYGDSQPAGPITRQQLFQLYPRQFDVNKKLGWNVWRMRVPGWLLQIILKKAPRDFNTAGVTFDLVTNNGKDSVHNLKIQGHRVNPFRNYEVAVSEGIGRGASEISFLLAAFFDPEDTGIPIWSAMETELLRAGGVIKTSDFSSQVP